MTRLKPTLGASIAPAADQKRFARLCDKSSSECSDALPTPVFQDAEKSAPSDPKAKSKIFPSMRFFMALLLCLCYISLAISTSNISLAMTCMVPSTKAVQSAQAEHDTLMQRIRRSISDADFDKLMELAANETGAPLAKTSLNKCAMAKLRKAALFMMKDFGQNVTDHELRTSTIKVERCRLNKLNWSATEQGLIYAAQNAGSLLMLLTGTQADRLNSKWTIVVSMSLLVASNAAIPFVSHISIYLALLARVLTGLSDALLQPSTSAMITRWFPPKERPFAIGLITGGRQIGTLLVLPVAGVLCAQETFMGGWPAIFYLSALVGCVILLTWVLMSADKPSKHPCIRRAECAHIEQKIREENLGKRKHRKRLPWRQIAGCVPLYAGVAALVCHEWPLVIILQLLPMYLADVLSFGSVKNGFASSLPIAVLFLSKTFSSSLSSYLSSNKRGRYQNRTRLTKAFNFIASLGLGLSLGAVPFVKDSVLPIVLLCLANAFAGLHTPGVQTALLQLAPAYTGIVTGIAFGVVAVFSIFNKLLNTYITSHGSATEWHLVFYISAVIAVLPCFFFSVWGSAERQAWATSVHRKRSSRPPSAADGAPVTVSGRLPPPGPPEGAADAADTADAPPARLPHLPANASDRSLESVEEDEENICSALRMDMFLCSDDDLCSTEEETLSHSSGSERDYGKPEEEDEEETAAATARTERF